MEMLLRKDTDSDGKIALYYDGDNTITYIHARGATRASLKCDNMTGQCNHSYLRRMVSAEIAMEVSLENEQEDAVMLVIVARGSHEPEPPVTV